MLLTHIACFMQFVLLVDVTYHSNALISTWIQFFNFLFINRLLYRLQLIFESSCKFIQIRQNIPNFFITFISAKQFRLNSSNIFFQIQNSITFFFIGINIWFLFIVLLKLVTYGTEPGWLFFWFILIKLFYYQFVSLRVFHVVFLKLLYLLLLLLVLRENKLFL